MWKSIEQDCMLIQSLQTSVSSEFLLSADCPDQKKVFAMSKQLIFKSRVLHFSKIVDRKKESHVSSNVM